MSRTISVSGVPPDIDGRIVNDVESLRQRIHAAIRFRLGEWFFAPARGLDYDLILGHTTTTGQAAQVIVSTIRGEGGHEVTNVRDIFFELDNSTRRFSFRCSVDTIYGDPIDIDEVIPSA